MTNLATDCTTPYGPPYDVTLGAGPSYGLIATEANSLGYSASICYKCEIIPTGLSSLFFTHIINVVGDPLDCNTSLTPTGFANPANIPYNSAGSAVTIAADISAIFTHTSAVDCPLTSCVMMLPDCVTPYGA